MTADIVFQDMHLELFEAFGRDVLVVPAGTADAINARAIVNEGVERIGEYGQSIGRVTVLDFMALQYRPQPRDTVSLLDPITGHVVWMRPVASIDADDGFVIKAVLHG